MIFFLFTVLNLCFREAFSLAGKKMHFEEQKKGAIRE